MGGPAYEAQLLGSGLLHSLLVPQVSFLAWIRSRCAPMPVGLSAPLDGGGWSDRPLFPSSLWGLCFTTKIWIQNEGARGAPPPRLLDTRRAIGARVFFAGHRLVDGPPPSTIQTFVVDGMALQKNLSMSSHLFFNRLSPCLQRREQ